MYRLLPQEVGLVLIVEVPEQTSHFQFQAVKFNYK
jgi:hypothetical protein